MLRRSTPFAAVLLLLGLAAGCTRPSPFHGPIEAGSPAAFLLWRSSTTTALSSRQWALFDRALQEMRIQVMIAREATGTEAIERAVHAKIDGQPLFDVVHTGLQQRVQRLHDEKSDLESIIRDNARLRTRHDDPESADALARVRDSQAARMEKLLHDIAAAESDLAELDRYK